MWSCAPGALHPARWPLVSLPLLRVGGAAAHEGRWCLHPTQVGVLCPLSSSHCHAPPPPDSPRATGSRALVPGWVCLALHPARLLGSKARLLCLVAHEARPRGQQPPATWWSNPDRVHLNSLTIRKSNGR